MSIAVVGDVMLDVAAAAVEPIVEGGDTPAAIRLAIGGQGANIAVRLVRRGVAVPLTCAIGEDAPGRLLRTTLAAEGVDVRAVSSLTSGTVVVVVDPSGERTMLSQRAPLVGALAASPRPVDEGTAWIVLSGYPFMEAGAGSVFDAIAGRSARRAVVGCSLSAGRAGAWADAVRSVRPDLVILNLDEAAAVAGPSEGPRDGPSLARAMATRFGCLALVTRRDGADAADPRGGDVAVDRPVDGPVARDTTGAGDAFAAATVDRLARSTWPPDRGTLIGAVEEAVRLATAVAQVPGAQGRVPGEPAAAGDASATLNP